MAFCDNLGYAFFGNKSHSVRLPAEMQKIDSSISPRVIRMSSSESGISPAEVNTRGGYSSFSSSSSLSFGKDEIGGKQRQGCLFKKRNKKMKSFN